MEVSYIAVSSMTNSYTVVTLVMYIIVVVCIKISDPNGFESGDDFHLCRGGFLYT